MPPVRVMDFLAPMTDSGPGAREAVQRRWFVTLWVMAMSFHYDAPGSVAPIQGALVLAALPVVFAPLSSLAFGAFVVVTTLVFSVSDLPAAGNHVVLALVVHVTLALAMLFARPRAGWLTTARAPLVIVASVVYGFAAFQKMNAGFFDPSGSCAGTLMTELLGLNGLGWHVLPRSLIVPTACITLVWEAGMAVGLLVRRLRLWAIVVGTSAHLLLAFAHFWDFAAVMLALYVVMLPAEAANSIRQPESWRRLAMAGWVAYATVTIAAWRSSNVESPLGLTWNALQVIAWTVSVGSLVGPWIAGAFRLPSAAFDLKLWPIRPAWLLLGPVLAAANGLTPYCGIKTVSNYSMFSNLRVEGGHTNHFLIPDDLLPAQSSVTDLVEVRALRLPARPAITFTARLRGGEPWILSSTRWIDEDLPIRLPFAELRRAAWLWKDTGLTGVSLTYTRGGVEYQVHDAAADPTLTGETRGWNRYFVAFRAVQPDHEPVACRW
jgi:hypothetical protein